MGRKDNIKKNVLLAFVEAKTVNSRKIYQCKFCGQNYRMNVTRMSKHLIQKCVRCPTNLKSKIQNESKARNTHVCRESPNYFRRKTESDSESDADLPEKVAIKFPNQNNDKGNTSTMSIPSSSSTSEITSSALMGHHRPKTSSVASTSATLESFVDFMDKTEEDSIWELLSRACYATNTPLSFTENIQWKNAFKMIRPSLKLPTRYQLSNDLLIKEYDRIKNLVDEKISEAKTVGLQLDGWSNIRNESIINVIVTTPDPVLFKIVDTKSNRHDANYLYELACEIIEEIGINKVMSVCTDNAKNMRAMWVLLQDKYPSPTSMFSCYGCSAHILNLLVQDILKIELFHSITLECKAIIKKVKKSHVLKATFTDIQIDKIKNKDSKFSIKSLKLPAKTRWGSICMCLESLLANKKPLQELAITENIQDILDNNIKSSILNDRFWNKIDTLYNLLKPIYDYIINVQTTKSYISQIVEVFHNLEAILAENSVLEEINNISDLLQKRRVMALRPVHFAANLLDPYFIGKNLSNDEYIEALTYITKVSSFMLDDSDLGTVMAEIALYKAKEGLFAKEFVWKSLDEGKLPAVVWWKSLCSTTKISKVASEILNCPPTSAATERSFSTFGNTHTKKRNRLTNDRAGKLVYIQNNLNLFENKILKREESEVFSFSDSADDSDSVVEVSEEVGGEEQYSSIRVISDINK